MAVDWSGARDVRAQHEHIWVAVVEDGHLVELSAGRTREETVEHLLAEPGKAPSGPEVVGLDFSFGFPEWFARAHGCPDGRSAWALAARDGERWLRDCPPPFFGPKGTRRPPGTELYRWTEREVRRTLGLRPKSIFQLAGPGAVGVGSLRGMPLLAALRERGFAVWPFDPAGVRTVVELYPALATARSAGVAQPDGRRRFLDAHHPGITAAWPAAVQSRDAFDAVVAAHLLAGHLSSEWANRGIGPGDHGAPSGPTRLEGAMWLPPPRQAETGGGTRFDRAVDPIRPGRRPDSAGP